jgi:hypothetical protein
MKRFVSLNFYEKALQIDLKFGANETSKCNVPTYG